MAIPGSSQASVTLNGTNLDITMAGQSSSLAVPAGAQVSQCLLGHSCQGDLQEGGTCGPVCHLVQVTTASTSPALPELSQNAP